MFDSRQPDRVASTSAGVAPLDVGRMVSLAGWVAALRCRQEEIYGVEPVRLDMEGDVPVAGHRLRTPGAVTRRGSTPPSSATANPVWPDGDAVDPERPG